MSDSQFERPSDPPETFDLSRRLAAEALGTAILVATVVGSGIMAETLTKDVALALLCNTLPTGAILVVLITVLGPISGAHFNPAVTMVFTGKRELPPQEALLYVIAQIAGGIAGTMAAHLMFGLPLIDFSMKVRTGGAQWFAEAVAAFGLVATILAGIRFQRSSRSLAGRPLHHGGLLVYGLHILCQSGRRDRPIADQYVLRHTSGRSAGLHRRRALRSIRRHAVDELAARTSQGARPGPDRRDIPMSVTIYHNPDCGTSRNTLAIIRQSGEEPTVIEYLKTPPSRERLKELIAAMDIPVRALLREKGTPYKELGLDDPKWTDEQLIDQMLAHPILINRPIVVTPKGVRLCRPSEVVLDVLPNPEIGRFVKEDGEVVEVTALKA